MGTRRCARSCTNLRPQQPANLALVASGNCCRHPWDRLSLLGRDGCRTAVWVRALVRHLPLCIGGTCWPWPASSQQPRPPTPTWHGLRGAVSTTGGARSASSTRAPKRAPISLVNEEGPAFYRAWAEVMGVRRQGLEPRTVALRESRGRPQDLRRSVAPGRLPGHSLAGTIRYCPLDAVSPCPQCAPYPVTSLVVH
jgi:hypothetical protein